MSASDELRLGFSWSVECLSVIDNFCKICYIFKLFLSQIRQTIRTWNTVMYIYNDIIVKIPKLENDLYVLLATDFK